MVLEAEYWLVGVVAAVVALALCIYRKGTENFDYWRSKGVPYVPGVPFLGSVPRMILQTSARSEELRRLYDALDGHPFGGFFMSRKPVLLLRDPEIIKKVMVEDFRHFNDRFAPPREGHPMASNLFQVCGSKWRFLRRTVTPAFSVGKLKAMVRTMCECSGSLCEDLRVVAEEGAVVDAKEFSRNFALDVIGSCVYGLQLNCIGGSDEILKQMTRDTTKLSWRLAAASFLAAKVPTINFCGLRPEVVNYFWDLAKKAMKFREGDSGLRKDFLSILIKLKERGYIETDANEDSEDPCPCVPDDQEDVAFSKNEVTDDVVAAQCLIFFIAGFETSSAAISFCLFELALNPSIQRKLRAEILRVLPAFGGKMCYLAVRDMTYLHQVVAETLRKHSPASTIMRTCTKPYVIPGTEVMLDVGDTVLVPIPGIHHDPANYPDPERFDPDRFSEGQAKRRHRYTYLPFGAGPRGCVGSMFGMVQVKVAVASLISRYEFQACSRTPVPLVLDPRQIAKAAAGGMWLRIATTPQDCSARG